MGGNDEEYLEFLRYQEVDASNFANGRKPRKGEAAKIVKRAEREAKKGAKRRGRR